MFDDKGVKLSNKEIVAKTLSTDFDWILYHTRIVSKGNVCDEQCHPFVSPKKDYALAMNGTESHFGEIGKLLGTSDTDALFRIYHAFGIDNETLKTLDSRFMGFSRGKVFFTNPNAYYSSLEKMDVTDKSKAIVVASCFPFEIESEKIESGFYWEEGNKIKTSKIKYTKYSELEDEYYNYNYDSYLKKQTTVWECEFCGTIHKGYRRFDKEKRQWKTNECKTCGNKLTKLTIQGQAGLDYLNSCVD